MPSRINHMAVWVAAFVFFGWGYLFYGLLFGNQWMAAQGKTAADFTPVPTTFLWSFILGLILSYATAMALTRHPEDQTVSQGISFALFMGLALYATQTLNHVIYENIPMSLDHRYRLHGRRFRDRRRDHRGLEEGRRQPVDRHFSL